MAWWDWIYMMRGCLHVMNGEFGMSLCGIYMRGWIRMWSQIWHEQLQTLRIGNLVAWYWYEGKRFLVIGNTSWYWFDMWYMRVVYRCWYEFSIHGVYVISWLIIYVDKWSVRNPLESLGEASGSCFSGRDVIPWPLLVGVHSGAPSV